MEQLAVEQLVAHRAVEPFDVAVLLRAAFATNAAVTARSASQSATVAAMSSLPLSERMIAGFPRLANTRSSTRMMSRAPIECATCEATASRVKSSMFKIRSGAPSAVRAETKS